MTISYPYKFLENKKKEENKKSSQVSHFSHRKLFWKISKNKKIKNNTIQRYFLVSYFTISPYFGKIRKHGKIRNMTYRIQ